MVDKTYSHWTQLGTTSQIKINVTLKSKGPKPGGDGKGISKTDVRDLKKQLDQKELTPEEAKA